MRIFIVEFIEFLCATNAKPISTMCNMYRVIVVVLLVLQSLFAAPLMQTVNVNGNKSTRMKFLVKLPSNETVQVNLAFKLLIESPALPEFNESLPLGNTTSTTSPHAEILISSPTSSTPSSESEYDYGFLDDNTTTETFLETIPMTEASIPTTSAPISTAELVQVPAEYRNRPTEVGVQLKEAEPQVDVDEPNLLTVEEAIEDFRQNLIMKELHIAGIFESEQPFYRHFRLEYDDGIAIPIRCTYDPHFTERKLKISCYEFRDFGTRRILSNGEFESEPLPQYVPVYVDDRNFKQTYSMSISK